MDPELADLLSQRLTEPLQAPLRGVIHADGRERRDTPDRGHLDDVAAALLAQERQRSLRHPQRAEQIGLYLGASLLL